MHMCVYRPCIDPVSESNLKDSEEELDCYGRHPVFENTNIPQLSYQTQVQENPLSEFPFSRKELRRPVIVLSAPTDFLSNL